MPSPLKSPVKHCPTTGVPNHSSSGIGPPSQSDSFHEVPVESATYHRPPFPVQQATSVFAICWSATSAICSDEWRTRNLSELSQQGTSMITLTPFLLFDGNCAEAMAFYQSCLGGDLTITKVGDTPMKGHMPPEQHHKVAHAHLKSGVIE